MPSIMDCESWSWELKWDNHVVPVLGTSCEINPPSISVSRKIYTKERWLSETRISFNSRYMLNKEGANIKLLQLLPNIFHSISPGAHYSVNNAMKHINGIIYSKCKTTNHINSLHVRCFLRYIQQSCELLLFTQKRAQFLRLLKP